MTDSATQRHIRRSELAAAAVGGLDGFTPLNWVSQTGASAVIAVAAWDRGELVEVPVGKAWHVVRLPRALGWKTVRRMQENGTPVGPVQHTPDGVEVLVPVGSVADWLLPDSYVLTGGTVAVPHPSMVAPHTQAGHSWIVSPQECVPLTDADLLHEAYAAALDSIPTDAAL
ncbi:hypothetical protein AB0N17_19965 [Streptomyces sp. NPDC051133]|uniref:hypothetical protein n=1 Tax=Streptomyces sp. NPDC051133 TaxID=3155521 RepID=UPI00343E0FB8